MTEPRARTFEIAERPEVPWLSVVLGYGPMLPFVGGAILAWVTRGAVRAEFVLLTILYTASILLFLAGVRRGLSFRTAGGPRVTQIATMFGLYALGVLALFAVVEGFAIVATALLLAGFACILVLDPIAARDGEAPLFFARLRPPQMAIAVASLAGLLASLLVR